MPSLPEGADSELAFCQQLIWSLKTQNNVTGPPARATPAHRVLLTLMAGSRLLQRRALDAGSEVQAGWGPGVSGVYRSVCWTFGSRVFILFRLTDLCGAAGLGLTCPGSRSTEQEVWKVCRGRCCLAGVVNPEALPGTTGMTSHFNHLTEGPSHLMKLPESSPYRSALNGCFCGDGAADGPLAERPGAGKSGRSSSRHLPSIIVLFHLCAAARVQDDVRLRAGCCLHTRRVHLHGFHLLKGG